MDKSEQHEEVLFDGERYQRISLLLLTKAQCSLCEQAKEILSRLSREYWLSVTTLPLDSAEGQRLAVAGGLLFPPGLVIDGEPFCYGRLSERKLRRELDRLCGSGRRELGRVALQSLPTREVEGALPQHP